MGPRPGDPIAAAVLGIVFQGQRREAFGVKNSTGPLPHIWWGNWPAGTEMSP